ncbi:Hypothetical protein NTJ_09132 [Nesidiocoris tenuis]|uniref:Uncharacterized protein n=1 Tax=Nesidiocoris tenuis TaxID=355587 RepID=A0ABN7B0R7_9HEMI|nr:Hypothetical protein NTJ_09132 [Nesidiocoris tenuis]
MRETRLVCVDSGEAMIDDHHVRHRRFRYRLITTDPWDALISNWRYVRRCLLQVDPPSPDESWVTAAQD